MTPGRIPPLRLRATPVLASAGERVTVELIRGPSFQGSLPREITFSHLRGTKTLKLKAEERTVALELDDKVSGFGEFVAGEARARIYIRPKADLAVALSTDRGRYSPGQTARLRIRTTRSGQPGKAAVGLIGVDESLGQLVSLPGADE